MVEALAVGLILFQARLGVTISGRMDASAIDSSAALSSKLGIRTHLRTHLEC